MSMRIPGTTTMLQAAGVKQITSHARKRQIKEENKRKTENN